jgi:Undecaprenyl-phosphate glucose phosphotransferase
MLKRYRNTVGDLLRIVDGFVMVAAWLVSYWLRFYLAPFALTKGLPPFDVYAALSPLVAVLWMAVFMWMRVYESRRLLGRAHEIRLILRAHGMAMLCFVTVTYLFEEYKFSRLVMGYFGVVSTLGIVAFRVVLRSVLRDLRARGFNLRHVLVVGEGSTLETLITRLERYPELGLRVRGVVTQEGSVARFICGRRVLGHYKDLTELTSGMRADEVIIALPPSQHYEVDRILDLIKDETVDIRLIPAVDHFATLGCEVENFAGLPLVRINDSPLEGWGSLAKRVTDVLASAAALIVLSPLLLLIGVLVKLTSPGPMFFVQERMGLDRGTFRMLKFRSMRIDAEARTGAVWAQRGDDRRTAFGAFLRRTSLDELPQLWNVLRGDMALVGPRPERPVFVDRFRTQIPHYMLRHKVKAGITGWAQVNGWRGNTSLQSRIECDLFYIRNWSYTFDIKIITMTLWKGFTDKNAY